MSKKAIKTTKTQGSKPAAKQAETAYRVEEEDLDDGQQGFGKTAAAGPGALKSTPAPATRAIEPQPATPAKPLARLETLWPGSVPTRPESKPAQAPARPAQVVLAPPATGSKPAAAPGPPTPKPQIVPEQSRSTPAPPQKVNTSFVLFEPKAKKVAVCGDFNSWASDTFPMKPRGDGRWEGTVAIAPGRHEYKFIVDGQWIDRKSTRLNSSHRL